MKNMAEAPTDAYHSPKRYAETAIANALGSHGGPGQGSHFTAVSSPPTLHGSVEYLGEQVSRLREAVTKARLLADALVGHVPEGDDPKTTGKLTYDGLVGNLNFTADAISFLLNELVHHHGRIERALIL